MEFKGFNSYLTDFKIQPFIITKEETIQLYNYQNRKDQGVKDGFMNFEMWK